LTPLPYLEAHLVDHCNLRCRRCGHFSNIAPRFAEPPHRFARALQQLATLIPSIRTIRLMGGEPLLHPEPEAFVRATRASYPDARVILVTNGLRLPAASPALWAACRETGTQLHITAYPPHVRRLRDWLEIGKREGVHTGASRPVRFSSWHNPRGDSDPHAAMAHCRTRTDCPLLYRGRVYPCATSAMAWAYHGRFGSPISQTTGYDPGGKDATADDLVEYLAAPVETCRWCATETTRHPWDAGPSVARDWWAG